jgi:hypothetical protein
MTLTKIELVDESVATEIFEAVAQGEDDVSDRNRVVADQPGPSEGWFTEEGQQCDWCALGIKGVAVKGVVLAHHLEKDAGVVVGCEAK